ncbi:putative immunity protein [Devosia ginsengisoli]|uniref:putative immunity protein n=1 Tax=Devosia ginsengisoli TaxID=400770 RepID=UPI0026F30910|nr:hypothetical protein [Devosia ginsengisoli]MCR6672476.1 hypothetical protein [Devosia ginsengisoli]
MAGEVVLELDALRAVAAYAAESAADVLALFEQAAPSDSRPRDAVDAALAFARGGKRVKALRDASWTALKAAQETDNAAASQAARAAMAASAAAYLHPLPNATQVKHILGAAAHAARAAELAAGDDPAVGDAHIQRAALRAPPDVLSMLRQFPPAPPGSGRVGQLLRTLDTALRAIP